MVAEKVQSKSKMMAALKRMLVVLHFALKCHSWISKLRTLKSLLKSPACPQGSVINLNQKQNHSAWQHQMCAYQLFAVLFSMEWQIWDKLFVLSL